MFIVALLVIAKIWRQPRSPSVGERINKPRHNQTTEYYSALKKKAMSYQAMKKHGGNLNAYY